MVYKLRSQKIQKKLEVEAEQKMNIVDFVISIF
jgi:hypothetical protein